MVDLSDGNFLRRTPRILDLLVTFQHTSNKSAHHIPALLVELPTPSTPQGQSTRDAFRDGRNCSFGGPTASQKKGVCVDDCHDPVDERVATRTQGGLRRLLGGPLEGSRICLDSSCAHVGETAGSTTSLTAQFRNTAVVAPDSWWWGKQQFHRRLVYTITISYKFTPAQHRYRYRSLPTATVQQCPWKRRICKQWDC